MSFINGIGALGSGLSSLAALAAQDEADQRRPSLLSSPATATQAPPTDDAAPAKASAPTPAAAAIAATGSVPPDLLPIYESAAKRTGIPVDVLIAQGKQESGWNPNAVGSAGEIGVMQVKPSTAANPGYGLKPIDPATLKDPAVNIAFAADYLRARAGFGADLSSPAALNRALTAYNGGGDPRYVQNVRQHMGTQS